MADLPPAPAAPSVAPDPLIGLGLELIDELVKVTLEEFRLTELRFETDSRLGRELLYLLSNNEWSRRTTEIIDIDRVAAAETQIVVDVDPSYVVHEALRVEEGPLWLPLIALPPEEPIGIESATPATPDLPVSVQVTDTSGARLAELPQSQIRRQLAAALAETLVNRINQRLEGATGEPRSSALSREHQVLMAATIGQILTALPGRGTDTDTADVRRQSREARSNRLDHVQTELIRQLDREIELARSNVRTHSIPEGDIPSALTSREAEIMQAMRGIGLVVVPVAPSATATSFTVTMPSRRLVRHIIGRHRSLARLRVGILVPTAHADRVIQVKIPDGVMTLPRRRGFPRADAGIVCAAPPQFTQLGLLVDRLVTGPGMSSAGTGSITVESARPESVPWVRKQLAELAVVKLDAVIQALRHHYDLNDDPAATGRLLRQLWLLRVPLDRQARGLDPETDLRRSWYRVRDIFVSPPELRRRLERNTASPGLVQFRAAAIEEFTLHGEPLDAYVELTLGPRDSPVLGEAMAVNSFNILVLLLVAVGLWVQNSLAGDALNRAQVLSALLAIFPTIQAARVTRPDPGRLTGLLQVPHFVLGLATAAPGLLLAGALAFQPDGPASVAWAGVALALQIVTQLVIAQRRDGGSLRWRPGVSLQTRYRPRQDGLTTMRTVWCRALTGEALLIGRTAFPYLVVDRDQPGAFQELLRLAQGAGADAGGAPSVNLLGVLLGAASGGKVMFLVFRDEPARLDAESLVREGVSPLNGSSAPPQRWVGRVRLTPGRLVPIEPPNWVLDVMVGIDRHAAASFSLTEHPLHAVAQATARANFVILNVRMPAPPPVREATDRQWLRLRIGVPYRSGDSLRKLRDFFDDMRKLRSQPNVTVHLREVPLTVSMDSTQTAPEDTFNQVSGFPGPTEYRTRLVTEQDVDVLSDEPGQSWMLITVCAPARVGLMGRIIEAVEQRPSGLSLASAVSGIFGGIDVTFLLCRTTRDQEEANRALGEALTRTLELSDHAVVPWAAVIQSPAPPSGRRVLLSVQVRTPDRPGALQHLLTELQERLREATGQRSLPDLDVLYALLPVVDGHALSGRMVVRLPAIRSDWQDLRWAEVSRAVSRGLAGGGSAHHSGHASYERTAQISDDSVVTLELVRAGLPSS